MSEEKEDPYNWAQIVRNNRKKIAELKEHYKEHFEKGFHHRQIDRLEEVLRELMIWFSESHAYANEDEMTKANKERFGKLMDKLGGDSKPSKCEFYDMNADYCTKYDLRGS